MAESRNFVCEWTDALCTNGACTVGSCVMLSGAVIVAAPELSGEARRVTPLGRSRVSYDVRLDRMRREVAGKLVSEWERQNQKHAGSDRRARLVAKYWKHPAVVEAALQRVKREWVWPADALKRLDDYARGVMDGQK